MGHQTQYWLTCPQCGHQMEVNPHEGIPLRARYCDECDSLFCFRNEELAIAESVRGAVGAGAS